MTDYESLRLGMNHLINALELINDPELDERFVKLFNEFSEMMQASIRAKMNVN